MTAWSDHARTTLHRAPLLPVAAAVVVLFLVGPDAGSKLPAFDPHRPVTAEVAVPVLGATAWERADGGWAARARILAVVQGGRQVAAPGRAWLRLNGGEAPPLERRLRVRGYFSRRPAYRNLHRSSPGDWGLNVKSRLLIDPVGEPPGRGLRAAARLRQRLLRAVDEAQAQVDEAHGARGLERQDAGRRAGASAGRGDATQRQFDQVERRFGQIEGQGALLARALVFGDARRVPATWRTGLRRAGLSHLLAVSGLHVGLLLGGFWWIANGLGSRFASVGAVAVLLLYFCLVGPRPSLVRAAVMALLVILSLAMERPPQAFNSLCAALLAILAFDPAAASDLGFRLSFLATAGILLLAPRLLNSWGQPDSVRWARPVVVALAATVSAQLATIPVTAVEMGLITPLSPVFNLAFVPLTALTLGCSLAWVAAAALASVPLVGVVAEPCARALGAALDLLSLPFAWLSDLPAGALLALPVSVGPAAALALAVWLGVLLSGSRRALLALALVLVCTPALPDEEPKLVMLDVGQGEAILLRSGERGPVILVDGGGFRRGNFAEAALLQALAAEGVHRIDLAILSHGDSDHCRGLLELTWYLRIERLWAAPVELRDGCGQALAERLGARKLGIERPGADGPATERPMSEVAASEAAVPERQGTAERPGTLERQGGTEGQDTAADTAERPDTAGRRETAEKQDATERSAGRVRGVGRGFTERVGGWNLEVLHPGPGGSRGGNSASLVVRACTGGSCALLTGDLDLAGERELLVRARREGAPVRSDVLKVGHHGSRTSTGAELLAAVAPRLAVVSAGRRNSYGHPAPEVVVRMKRRGIRVLRTDLHGRIEVRFRRDGAAGRRPVAQVADWPRRSADARRGRRTP